ncbi:hypothetical protein QVD17_28816 [Tagetes erecta]|uniref:Uncharacterized protein n=1 Tax=Tagetes erecta TaxID=13708 RepID=A0AAD8KB62_TARER|nr:hypothetical protein QVD17_28816 [Tagetes erecta]
MYSYSFNKDIIVAGKKAIEHADFDGDKHPRYVYLCNELPKKEAIQKMRLFNTHKQSLKPKVQVTHRNYGGIHLINTKLD